MSAHAIVSTPLFLGRMEKRCRAIRRAVQKAADRRMNFFTSQILCSFLQSRIKRKFTVYSVFAHSHSGVNYKSVTYLRLRRWSFFQFLIPVAPGRNAKQRPVRLRICAPDS